MQRPGADGAFKPIVNKSHEAMRAITQPWPTKDGRWVLTHHPAEPRKGGRGDHHGEMALAAGARAGVAGMTVRFVNHDEAGRRKPLGQLAMDRVGDGHLAVRPDAPVPSCNAAAAARKPASSSTI